MAKKASDATNAPGKRKKSSEEPAAVQTAPVLAETDVVAASKPATQPPAAVAVSSEVAPPPRPNQNVLVFNISAQLKSKIAYQAAEEGISINEYVSELLAEGVVLRAWEIVEKKAQMRGGVANSQPQNNNRNNNNHNGGGNPNRNQQGGRNDRFNNRRGMSNSRYNNIMEDKASFLEYVRNQERQQGR